MLETNFQKIYTTVLAKESIFYKTHSMSRQPVNFFLLLKVTIYVMKYGSLGKGLVENLQSRGGGMDALIQTRDSHLTPTRAAPWRTNNKSTQTYFKWKKKGNAGELIRACRLKRPTGFRSSSAGGRVRDHM